MNKWFILLLLILLTSCSVSQTSETSTNSETNTDYVSFILNVHDWVDPEKSADAVTKIIDIHEKYNVPVSIYLDDQVFQIYMKDYPELVERLKTSPVVTVSYHVRPPLPVYTQFGIYNYSQLSSEELYPILIKYEEHKINLSDGKPIESSPGGYQYVKDSIGYSPVAVSLIFDTPAEKETMAKIYKEKGASLAVVHSGQSKFGEKLNGLTLRPEDVEIKLYENLKKYISGKTPKDIIDESIAATTSVNNPMFINIKMHENNFYTSGTPFELVYFPDYNERSNPLAPPYDLSNADPSFRSSTEEEQMWAMYEEAVKYVSENKDLYTAVNDDSIKELLNL